MITSSLGSFDSSPPKYWGFPQARRRGDRSIIEYSFEIQSESSDDNKRLMWELLLVPLGSDIETAERSSVLLSEVLMNRSPDHLHFLGILEGRSAIEYYSPIQHTLVWPVSYSTQLLAGQTD